MDVETTAYTLALSANLCFAFAVQVFTHYARKLSPVWVNCFKASIALILFTIASLCFADTLFHSYEVSTIYFLSGLIGLALGDLALLYALKDIGPGRAMIFVAFHPLIMAIIAFAVLGQSLPLKAFWAILLMIGCIIVFALEKMKTDGKWHIKGVIFVFIAVIMDVVGLIMTRKGLDISGGSVLEANMLRCLGAVSFFIVWSFFRPIDLIKGIKEQKLKGALLFSAAAFMGTFLAIMLITHAIKITSHMAVVASINVSSSIFAATFECIIQRKLPTRYLIISFILMFSGLYIFMT